LYLFKNLSDFDNITHFVSSRKGGCSNGQFKSLNIGFNIGDDDHNVIQNRKALSEATDISFGNFTFARQCHGSNIFFVDNSLRGSSSADEESSLGNADGMITSLPDICITVKVADCVPVLLYEPDNHAAAVIHAGWKGTVNKITGKAVEKMIRFCGSKPGNIYAGIGPSIGPCCYETGNDVYREYMDKGFTGKDIMIPSKQKDKYYLNLWQANKKQLTELGVKPENIEEASICTKCNNESFFSSRASDGKTGRFAAGIMLKKK